MRISREGISHLSRKVAERLSADASLRMLKDRELVRQVIAQVLVEELREQEERHAEVRRKLESLDGAPPFGSAEWQSTFERMLEQEYDRYGFENTNPVRRA